MDTHPRLLRPAPFLVGSAVAALLVGSPVLADEARQIRPDVARALVRVYGSDPVGKDNLRPGERALLEESLVTARRQLQLAGLGVSQASNSDVRDHAQRLLSDARHLIDAVDALIRRKGVPAGRTPDLGATAEQRELAAKAGPEFDRAFVRAMGALHGELIALFERAASEAKDPDVRELASSQLPMLRKHRNAITELKKATE